MYQWMLEAEGDEGAILVLWGGIVGVGEVFFADNAIPDAVFGE